MTKFIFATASFMMILSTAFSQEKTDPKDTEVWEPEPRVVTPGKDPYAPPSDAIVLFDGKNLDSWVSHDGKPARWSVGDGAMTVAKGTGDIKTKQSFGDIQLHIEWRTPGKVEGEGQGRGNSGIFFCEKYELQVLDSYNKRSPWLMRADVQANGSLTMSSSLHQSSSRTVLLTRPGGSRCSTMAFSYITIQKSKGQQSTLESRRS
jgi:hypothetical protein